MNNLHWTTDFLIKQGVREEFVQWIALGIDIILLVLISWVADFIARRILLSIIHTLVKRSKATWDDYFFEQKVFKNLAHLVPAWIVHTSVYDPCRDQVRQILKDFLLEEVVVPSSFGAFHQGVDDGEEEATRDKIGHP